MLSGAWEFPGLESVILSIGEVLHSPGKRIRHVYFPTGALVSLFTHPTSRDDVAVELALVGCEGMVGVSLALGDDIACTRALVQAAGTAMRATSEAFLEGMRQTPALRDRACRYSNHLASLFAQSAGCQRNHGTRQRLARWLLLARQHLGTEELQLTQQFLAQLLAVRRSGVTEAAVELKHLGLIGYKRGIVVILDEAGLKAVSCPCLGPVGRRGSHQPPPASRERASLSPKAPDWSCPVR